MGDPLQLVVHSELMHYRERWKSTQSLSDQRVTMLLTAVGSAIVLTTALMLHQGSVNGVNKFDFLSWLWAFVSFVSEGIFLRLVRARRSICKDIEIINRLRAFQISQSLSDDKNLLEPIFDVDSKPPNLFSIVSSPTSAAFIVGGASFTSVWLGTSGLVGHPPEAAYFLAAALVVLDCLVFLRLDRNYRSHTLTVLRSYDEFRMNNL